MHDHYELFGLIFGLTAARVVERADPEHIGAVLSAARGVADTDPADPAAFNAANNAFLAALHQAASAPRLTSMARVMSSIVPGNFFAEVPGSIASQRKGVAAVARAIKAGDAAKAELEFAAMLRRQGDAVVTLLQDRGLFASGEATSSPRPA